MPERWVNILTEKEASKVGAMMHQGLYVSKKCLRNWEDFRQSFSNYLSLEKEGVDFGNGLEASFSLLMMANKDRLAFPCEKENTGQCQKGEKSERKELDKYPNSAGYSEWKKQLMDKLQSCKCSGRGCCEGAGRTYSAGGPKNNSSTTVWEENISFAVSCNCSSS